MSLPTIVETIHADDPTAVAGSVRLFAQDGGGGIAYTNAGTALSIGGLVRVSFNSSGQLKADDGTTALTLNPNSGSSDDAISTPTGTVWRYELRFPGDRLPVVRFLNVPDGAGPYEVADILAEEPGGLLPTGSKTYTDEQVATRVAIAGDTMTGPLALTYTGADADVVASRKRSADTYDLYQARADGKTSTQNPFGPVSWGAHNGTSRGSGSDFDHYLEHTGETAHLLQLTFARQRVTDGTHFANLAFPVTFPISNGSILVTSTTGFASSGTLTYSSGQAGQTGTITYTSTDATHFLGCTSSGIVASTDTSAVHAFWVTDSFGAPIAWLSNYGGLFVNDQITFRAAGVFTDSDQDIIVGFDDPVNRTGASVKIGNDGNIKWSRTSDGFGNNGHRWYADGNLLNFYSAGLYAGTALNLGTTTNPWLNLYSGRVRLGDGTMALPAHSFGSETSTGAYRAGAGDLRWSILATDAAGLSATKFYVPTGSTIDIGTDSNVSLDRSDDGFGNNILLLRADSNSLRLQAAGFYPTSSGTLPLGTTTNLWSVVNANRARVGNGLVGTPSVSFLNDTGCGFYRAGSGDIRFAISGVDVYKTTSAGVAFLSSLTLDMGSAKITSVASGTANTDVANLGQVPGPGIRTGALTAVPHTSRVTSLMTVGQLIYELVWLRKATTLAGLHAEVTSGGGAGSVLKWGVYADIDGNGSGPGAAVYRTTTGVASTGTGRINDTAVSGTVVGPGPVWMAVVNQTNACTARYTLGLLNGAPVVTPEGANAQSIVFESSVTGALPATATPTYQMTSIGNPVLWFST